MELTRAEIAEAAAGAFVFASSSRPFGSVPPESSGEFSRSSKGLKLVLVIDDEEIIAESLSEILNRSGFEAVPFYSGQEAIEWARERCPDAVISDVVMPKVNGVELALAIRETCPSTQILLFSGQAATAHLIEEARFRGHEFEVLPKPIHPLRLLERLRKG